MTSVNPPGGLIPNRFEHLLRRNLEPTPLILPVEADLQAIDRLRRMARLQGGGLISFLLGESGSGKTTAAYAAPAHVSDYFSPVVSVPHDLPLREIYAWITARLPRTSDRTTPLLVDSREITDDAVGLRQLMAAINGLLRARSDVLVLWPTTDADWHRELRAVAHRIGGATLVPDEADIEIQGPARGLWIQALERLLVQLDYKLEDLAIERSTLDDLVQDPPTIGEFLRSVGALVIDRVQAVQIARQLPVVTFVVTSNSAVAGEANRIRRAATYFLKADELLGYSRRSKAGLWWVERNKTPEHHLGYIASLFQARLVTMTSSSVVYACAEFGDDILKNAIRAADMSGSPANGDRTIRSTDFYRLVANVPSPELTAAPKGRTAARTAAAYSAIQALSATRHKVINQSICRLMERNVPSFGAELGSFEVDLGSREVIADAVIPTELGDLNLEFHHIAEPNVSAMAAYIMGKLRDYAVRYSIIPR